MNVKSRLQRDLTKSMDLPDNLSSNVFWEDACQVLWIKILQAFALKISEASPNTFFKKYENYFNFFGRETTHETAELN